MGRRRDASGITMSLTMASTADASFSIDSVGGPREFRGLARRIGPFDCSNLKRLRSRSASKQCAVSHHAGRLIDLQYPFTRHVDVSLHLPLFIQARQMQAHVAQRVIARV
jgi:hypothetical protein